MGLGLCALVSNAERLKIQQGVEQMVPMRGTPDFAWLASGVAGSSEPPRFHAEASHHDLLQFHAIGCYVLFQSGAFSTLAIF